MSDLQDKMRHQDEKLRKLEGSYSACEDAFKYQYNGK